MYSTKTTHFFSAHAKITKTDPIIKKILNQLQRTEIRKSMPLTTVELN